MLRTNSGSALRRGCGRAVLGLALAALFALFVSSTAHGGALGGFILNQAVTAELVEVAQLPATATSPFTRINFLREVPDGSGRLFVNDLRGPMRIIDGANLYTYFDMGVLRPAFQASPGLGAGFVSFAFHPEFATSGLFYTVHTEAVGATPPTFVPALPGAIVQHAVLTEWAATTPASNSFSGTSRELMRIASVSNFHNPGEIAFNPNASLGDADYGWLYMGAGDYGATDLGAPEQVQRLDTLYGTIVRIDPLGGTGGAYSYGIPASNPFASDGDPNTFGEIYASGFRNAHRLHWDSVGAQPVFVSDIGALNIEEINLLHAGSNYGWPEREGPFVYDPLTSNVSALPGNDATLGFSYPVAQFDHSDGFAIAGGVVDRSVPTTKLYGKFLFGDIVKGRIYYADVAEMQAADDGNPATRAQVYELNLEDAGVPTTLLNIVRVRTGKPALSRVDLRFATNLAGDVFVLTKQDGVVRRLAVQVSVPLLPQLSLVALGALFATAGLLRLRATR